MAASLRMPRACARILSASFTLGLLSLATPIPASADSLFGVDKLLEKIDHIGVYWMGQSLLSDMDVRSSHDHWPNLQESGVELFVRLWQPEAPPKAKGYNLYLKAKHPRLGAVIDSVELTGVLVPRDDKTWPPSTTTPDTTTRDTPPPSSRPPRPATRREGPPGLSDRASFEQPRLRLESVMAR